MALCRKLYGILKMINIRQTREEDVVTYHCGSCNQPYTIVSLGGEHLSFQIQVASAQHCARCGNIITLTLTASAQVGVGHRGSYGNGGYISGADHTGAHYSYPHAGALPTWEEVAQPEAEEVEVPIAEEKGEEEKVPLYRPSYFDDIPIPYLKEKEEDDESDINSLF